MAAGIDNNALWYKDGIIYQLHIKAFRDGNNDGMGDFRGLKEKLDYISDLGVTAIWLLPFYPSPLRDDGYDTSDYTGIHPDYGTMEDFKEFLHEAHRRGLKVITELVLNHTSDQHEWFKKARMSPPGSSARNFYVWNDTPEKYKEARIIFSDFETSNWTYDPVAKAYFWHRFYSHQPDLNFDNPAVHRHLMKVVDYWLEMGVDGLRLDAVPYLYEREGTNCENLPETHEFLKKLNAHVQQKFINKMLLAEANQWPEDAVAYFGSGDECQMAFHFPLMPRLYMAIQMEERFPIIDILEQTPQIPDNCQWAMFLRNHDELTLEMVTDEERDYMYRFYARDKRARINLGIRRRLAPLVENNRRKIELLNILLFSFPGTPIVYYGDEIGMGDNFYLGDRNGVRTPMQWSPDRNAGFSSTNPQKLYLPVIIDPEYHYEAVNVEVQERSSSSLLLWMKRAIKIRKSHKAFGRGILEFLSPSNPRVLAFLRKYEDDVILIVANLSKFPNVTELDLTQYGGYLPVEAFSGNYFPQIRDDHPFTLTLNPYDYYWFILEKKSESSSRAGRMIPVIEFRSSGRKSIETEIADILEDRALVDFMKNNEDYNLKNSPIQEIKIVDHIAVQGGGEEYYLAFVRLTFADRLPELYLLPLGVTKGERAEQLKASRINDVIAAVKGRHSEYIIFDALQDESFRNALFRQLSTRKILNASSGKLIISTVSKLHLPDISAPGDTTISSQILKGDFRRINILYNNKLQLKLYRRLEEGVSPGIEMLNHLSQNTEYKNIPVYRGAVMYKQENSEPLSLGLFKDYSSNEGDAYDYFQRSALQYFDRVFSSRQTDTADTMTVNDLFTFVGSDIPTAEIIDEVDKAHFEMVSHLGLRIASMHEALARPTGVQGFDNEPFTLLYQRSIYQSFRSLLKSTIRLLRRPAANQPEEFRAQMHFLLDSENRLLNYAAELLKGRLEARKIRIHGDLHLAQILFTGKDFVISNFEGQIYNAVSERRLKRSPLRDVASILFSLYHAAYQAYQQYISTRPGEAASLESYVRTWWISMGLEFLISYYKCIKNTGLLPEDERQVGYLLRLYLFEKLFYELRWLYSTGDQTFVIPIKAIIMLEESLRTAGVLR